MIASPAQDLRAVFDLMPTDTVEDWAVISERLSAIPPPSTATCRPSARASRRARSPPAARSPRSSRRSPVTPPTPASSPRSLRRRARGGIPRISHAASEHAGAARVAYDELASFLSRELAPAATLQDGVGRDLYALHSRRFLGAEIDLDETYDCGVEELARMVAEQESIANEILPGAGVEEAVAFLEKDESRKLHGTDALRR